MAKQATATGRAATLPPTARRPRRRLTAEARKKSILKAARRPSPKTGDANGTTIRVIM